MYDIAIIIVGLWLIILRLPGSKVSEDSRSPPCTPRLDHDNAVLCGISDRLLHHLDMVQRSAATVVHHIRRATGDVWRPRCKSCTGCPRSIALTTGYAPLSRAPPSVATVSRLASYITSYVTSTRLVHHFVRYPDSRVPVCMRVFVRVTISLGTISFRSLLWIVIEPLHILVGPHTVYIL